MRVAIAGAGVSGLAAAVELANASTIEVPMFDVTVYEARRQAGGRTRSYVDKKSGDVIDNGQHLMMGCYFETLRYLNTIGSQSNLIRTSLDIPYSIAGSTGLRRLRVAASLPAPVNMLVALARTNLLTGSERLEALSFGDRIRRGRLPDLKSLTCAELFSECRQSSGTIAKLWEPIVLATINAAPEVASAEVFVQVIREAFFTGKFSSSLLFPSVGLSELLIEPAVRFITNRGVELRLGSPILSIRPSGSGHEVATDDQRDVYDVVIWAAPPSDLLKDIASIPKMDFSPIVSAYFWSDRKLLASPIHGFIGSHLQWAFSKRSAFASELIAATVSAGNELLDRTNEEITGTLWDELKAGLGNGAATLLHSQVIREKRATPMFTPETQHARPSCETAVTNFYLAGDIVQNGLPATIEGAVRNGVTAARSVIKRISSMSV